MTTFPFGSTVTCTAIYLRRRQGNTYRWESAPTAPRLGIYIGWRTLFDGQLKWDGFEDDIPVFHQSSHIRAALVVFSARTKPVLVPMSEVKPNCDLLAIEEMLERVALPFSDREIAKTYVNDALRNIVALQSWLKEGKS